MMADNGVTCSMSRSGNVWAKQAKVPAMRIIGGKPAKGNAAMDSFLSSMKTERIAPKTYRTRNHAEVDVFD